MVYGPFQLVAETPVAPLRQEFHRGTVPKIAYVMHNELGCSQMIALEVSCRRQRCEMVIWNIHFLLCVSVFYFHEQASTKSSPNATL